MKKTFISSVVATVLGLTAQAQVTLTAWTFDNLPIGLNQSPAPSAGLGAASALGMANGYNNTNSVSHPDVQSLPGSSTGAAGPNSWRIRGFSTLAGQGGGGWSTSASIGTQGAQFSGSTFGYYQITVSFDVYATPDAEANLQVQYTTDGSTWRNAAISSAGSGAAIQSNGTASATTNATVVGSYVALASAWNNQITVNLSGVAGVDNNANFGVRLVNASSGTNCLDTTGAVYNNLSGSWTFDNVAIQGVSIDTIAVWTFESEPNNGTIITNPVPEIGGGVVGQGHSLGFNNDYTYVGIGTGSTDASDVINTGGSSSGNAGPNAWRVRGAFDGNPGPGWNTAAPIGTQGTEYDVNTSGYSNIVCYFDLYVTSQGEAKLCVLYTTDGWATTNVANNFFYAPKPAYILTNSTSPNTVAGTYFYETGGQGFYNAMFVDFTGDPTVADNPLFGFRLVNAATGPDCVNATGGSYNNSSGNWRFDNVSVGGTAGSLPPAIAYDPNATVDNPFTNTFTENAGWRTNISAIYDNGFLLPSSAYTTTNPGEIVFLPSQSPVLQVSGLQNLIIIATGYGTARVGQPVGPGVATQLAVVTPAAGPSASGGTLTANPVFLLADQYGNGTTNPFANVSMTASVGGSGGWTLGGDTNQSSVNGLIAFTNLTASVNGSSAVANAVITFAIAGYPPLTVTNSPKFAIGVPPVPFTPGNLAVVQIDTLGNNTTFSVLELKPSAAGQTAAVNIVPISATGPNALRLSSSGSTGRLALSDDGTLLGFAAFADDSAATPDETLNLNRAAASLNYSNELTIGMYYTSISLGGSQARAACILSDDLTWIVDDKGGLYEGAFADGTNAAPNLNAFNNVVVKTFAGVPYVETQKAVNGLSLPVVYTLGLDPGTGLYDVTSANNLTTDPNASDFYLVSTNGGATYDILYINDQNSATSGVIKKYSLESGNWIANGTFTNKTGVDGLFATTNGAGGVYLFATTGSGGTAGNSLVRLTDASAWGQAMNVTSSNVIYTASANTSIKGLTFVPQQATNSAQPIPPPILAGQAGVSGAASQFTVATTPDDPFWRTNISTITVNGGAPLTNTAYTLTSAGKIVFNLGAYPSLFQTGGPLGVGTNSLVIASPGYSAGSVVQYLSPPPTVTTVGASNITAGAATLYATVNPNDASTGWWFVYGTNTTTSFNQFTPTNTLAAKLTPTTVSSTVTGLLPGVVYYFAIAASNTAGGAEGTVSSFTTLAVTAPTLSAVYTSSNSVFGITFTDTTGASFSVLGTNDLTAPLATWPVVGHPVESPAGSGNYQFSSPGATNSPMYYLLRQP